MKTININYAYSGFLYAPLILAYELGLFPKNMQIKYRNGDIPAIDSLAIKSEDTQNWFAICDPFAKDISLVQSSIGKDNIYIVGTLINKLPIWIYNSHNDIEPYATENDLIIHKHKIEEIRVYERYNTGFLIGERIRRKLDLAKTKIKEFKFGQEFTAPLTDEKIILTSDVIRIANDLDSKKIVFNYPNKCPELSTYLFTGILTLKSVIDEHLYAVLTVLAGLKIATDILLSENVDQEILDILKTKYKNDLDKVTTDPNEQMSILKKSIHLMKEEKIYTTIIKPDEAEIGYNNAKKEWENLLNKKFPTVEKCRDPLPSLLLKKNWEDDETVIKIFSDKLKEKEKEKQLRPPLKEGWLHYLTTLGILLVLIFGFYLALNNFPLYGHQDRSSYAFMWANLFTFIVQLFFSIVFFKGIISEIDFSKKGLYMAIIFACFGIELSIIQLIK